MAETLYRQAFGHDAKTTQRNTVFSSSTPFLSQATGDRDGATFVTQVQPGRVDVVIQPSSDALRGDGMPDMLEPTLVRSIARQVTEKRTPVMNTCFRVSMVTNLIRLVDDADTAAKEIIDHSGLDLDQKGLSDLTFSANRSVVIKDDFVMNRLMRFSVLYLQLTTTTSIGFTHSVAAVRYTVVERPLWRKWPTFVLIFHTTKPTRRSQSLTRSEPSPQPAEIHHPIRSVHAWTSLTPSPGRPTGPTPLRPLPELPPDVVHPSRPRSGTSAPSGGCDRTFPDAAPENSNTAG